MAYYTMTLLGFLSKFRGFTKCFWGPLFARGLHFEKLWFWHYGWPAWLMGCNLMYTVVSLVKCILTEWNYCHIHFCKWYKKLHHMEIFSFSSNSHHILTHPFCQDYLCGKALLPVYTQSQYIMHKVVLHKLC